MLSPLQNRKLRRLFHVYDVDDDGRIGPRDFARILENLRILHQLDERSPDFQELEASFRRRWEGIRRSADQDDDGEVSREEWLSYWAEVLQDDERYEAEVATLAGRMVALFDTDETGAIEADEFCDFFGAYGLGAAQARASFMAMDVDGDGRIDQEELLAMCHQFYRSDVPEEPGNALFGPLP